MMIRLKYLLKKQKLSESTYPQTILYQDFQKKYDIEQEKRNIT